MRDALWNLGSASLTTKDTAVASVDVADLGEPGSRPNRKTVPGDLYACFRNVGAYGTNDSGIYQIQSDSNSNFSTTPETYTFPQTAKALPAGTIKRYRCPTDLQRYVRAYPIQTSSGASVAGTVVVESWLELGPNK